MVRESNLVIELFVYIQPILQEKDIVSYFLAMTVFLNVHGKEFQFCDNTIIKIHKLQDLLKQSTIWKWS